MADPINLDLGPADYTIEVWRGARRNVEFTIETIDPAWLTEHPNPTDAELAEAPTVPVDLTGYTATSKILTSRSADAADSILVDCDVDLDVDRPAGIARVWFEVPNDHPKTSNWYLVIIDGDSNPFPVAAAVVTAKGQTR